MRVRVEQILRGIVIVALAVLLWQVLRPAGETAAREVSARNVSRGALIDWTRNTAPSRIQLQLGSVPERYQRTWLAALAGAGSNVAWDGDLTPLMIDARPIAAPSGGTRVSVASAPASQVVLSDDVGPIDTVKREAGSGAQAGSEEPSLGASVLLAGTPRVLTASTRDSRARTSVRDSLVIRKVLVIGSAGWESKFVIAALEEEGWKVDAVLRVAPGADVRQGEPTSIDTARYSAVIALDTAAANYAGRIVAYVRSGGGAVLTPEAASLEGMASLRPGSTGRSTANLASAPATVTLASLAISPITPREDAIALSQRGSLTTLAARRVGAGRVLQIAYEDTWRWRMNGGDNGLREHRQWWSNLLSDVAYAPRIPRAVSTSGAVDEDPAPLADLVAKIGSPTARQTIAGLYRSQNWAGLLFVLFLVSLVAEVASRRTRGAR